MRCRYCQFRILDGAGHLSDVEREYRGKIFGFRLHDRQMTPGNDVDFKLSCQIAPNRGRISGKKSLAVGSHEFYFSVVKPGPIAYVCLVSFVIHPSRSRF